MAHSFALLFFCRLLDVALAINVAIRPVDLPTSSAPARATMTNSSVFGKTVAKAGRPAATVLAISPQGSIDSGVQDRTRANRQVQEVDQWTGIDIQHRREGMDTKTRVINGIPVYNYHTRGYRKEGFILEQSANIDASDWLVTFRDNCTDEDILSLCAYVTCLEQGHPSKGGLGFADVRATENEIEAALGNASLKSVVKFLEPDSQFQALSPLEEMTSFLEKSLSSTPWNLDRVDQRNNTLDGKDDASANLGAGVHVFIFDTGVRTTHEQFQTRAKQTICTICNPPKVCDSSATDCASDRNGHGTHCAGTVGGKDFGVAKGATIHSVKVIDDNGLSRISSLPAGLDWIMSQNLRPAVASISLQLLTKEIDAVETWTSAIEKTVAAGITVVVAAGNQNEDSCTLTPSSIPKAITVGATTRDDSRASFSNWGSCLDIFAPGEDIVSAAVNSDVESSMMSGSSMACPLVAGVVAILLQRNPDLTPDEVREQLISAATQDVVVDAKGAPNKMLYMSDAYLETLPSVAPVVTTSTPSETSKKSDSKVGLIVGISVGALVLTLLLIGAAVFVWLNQSKVAYALTGRKRAVAGKNAVGAVNQFQSAPQWKPQEGKIKLDPNLGRAQMQSSQPLMQQAAHGSSQAPAFGLSRPAALNTQGQQAVQWPAHQHALASSQQQYQWPAYQQPTQLPPPQYHWPAHGQASPMPAPPSPHSAVYQQLPPPPPQHSAVYQQHAQLPPPSYQQHAQLPPPPSQQQHWPARS